MSRLLLVCLGGALGSGARYLVASWALRAFGPGFPRGTLFVNVAGSFAIAAVMTASLSSDAVRPDVRLFLTAGVLGGFTTFSSLTWETLALVDAGRAAMAAIYVAVSVAGGLVAGVLGALAARAVAG